MEAALDSLTSFLSLYTTETAMFKKDFSLRRSVRYLLCFVFES
jgi:hypothetical protein